MMPGFITNTLESIRRQKAVDLIRQVVARYLEENPPKAGDTGPAGPQGVKGDAGPQGERGPIGPQGPRGEAGAQGSKGDTGAVGPQGSVGPQGATGAQGMAGPQGQAGATGPVGPRGDVGATGPAGPSGATLTGTATITESLAISLVVQVRQVTVTLAGTVTTGNYIAVPVSKPPTGYGIMDAVCATNGQITVSVFVPVIQLLSSYNIPVRIYRLGA